MFTLQDLQRVSPINKPSVNDPMFTPARVNHRAPSDQTHRGPYEPVRPGDYVSRIGTHEHPTTIAIIPYLSVDRWPMFPTARPSQKLRAGMPTGQQQDRGPSRKNIARRGDQTYGSLSQLYPMIDTPVV